MRYSLPYNMVVPLQHSRKCNQVNSDRNQNHSHLGWREELVSCAGVRKLKRGVRHNPVFIDGDGFIDVFTWQSLPHHTFKDKCTQCSFKT